MYSLDIDIDGLPLDVDLHPNAREYVASLREVPEGDLARGRLFRFLNIGSWLDRIDDRWPAKVVGPWLEA